MNGKRAKALNRIRRGIVRPQDLQRLRRTEKRTTEADRRDAHGNPPTQLAQLVWGMK